MLAGLLFATHDADDRPDRLSATLPFGGVTLIEYQARLLIAGGAGQLVVMVSRLTPELLGALNRIGRRGVAVDAVRTAREAADKLHPLSRVLVLADGLITTAGVVDMLAADGEGGGDALLVVPEDRAGEGYERVGGRLCWAGVARLAAARVREVADMPRDYDLQSALLRVAAQARAVSVLLPAAAEEGHGIVRRAASLDQRGRAVLASIVSDRSGWFDRWVVAPAARLALPPLLRRGAPAAGMGAGALALGVGAAAAAAHGWWTAGLVLALLGVLAAAMGETLAHLRDEEPRRRRLALAALALPAPAVAGMGWSLGEAQGAGTAPLAAAALLVAAALGERAVGRRRLLGWGSPGAYLVLALLAALAGLPLAGLVLALAYAAATLGWAIERLRREGAGVGLARP